MIQVDWKQWCQDAGDEDGDDGVKVTLATILSITFHYCPGLDRDDHEEDGPGQRRQGFLLRLHGHGHRGGDRVWCVVDIEIFTSGAFDDGGIWKLPSNKQGWTSVYEQNS